MKKLTIFLLLGLNQCMGVFYQPNSRIYTNPKRFKISVQDIYFRSTDKKMLHAWLLKSDSKSLRGTVAHFHGNAQNISSHFLSTKWLVKEGYNVFIFDYRGYGQSDQTQPTPAGIRKDAHAALDYVRQMPLELRGAHLIVYGQSLGGIIASDALLHYKYPQKFKTLILESTFGSYQKIAVDKLSDFFLTWPFQWLGYLLVSDQYSPLEHLAHLEVKNKLVVHGSRDRIVPKKYGELIYANLNQNKQFWLVKGARHINCFSSSQKHMREKLIAYLGKVANE